MNLELRLKVSHIFSTLKHQCSRLRLGRHVAVMLLAIMALASLSKAVIHHTEGFHGHENSQEEHFHEDAQSCCSSCTLCPLEKVFSSLGTVEPILKSRPSLVIGYGLGYLSGFKDPLRRPPRLLNSGALI